MTDKRLSVEAEVLDDQAADRSIDSRRLERLVRFVLEREGAVGHWAVTVVLVDDQRLQGLHRDFMGIDEVTDVMTFPFDAVAESAGGEIVISVERAAEQGPEFGHSATTEVEFLVVHGLLHLLGWKDADPVDRAVMLACQSAVLRAFNGA